MTSRIFETWIETQLVPTLSPGDVVILGNVGFRKSERAEELVKAKGAWLLFLPPYSPDLNPIEMAFSKLKALLRKRAARSFDAITQALGDYSRPTNAETSSKLQDMRRNRCDMLCIVHACLNEWNSAENVWDGVCTHSNSGDLPLAKLFRFSIPSAESELSRELRASFCIVRSDHRIVSSQAPFLAIPVRRLKMVRHEMALH
jgi:transposase